MARNKKLSVNINNSDPVNFPDGRIRDNDGSGNGTPVNEYIYGDIHEFFAKAMRESNLSYNGLPDNVQNGYQLFTAIYNLAGKNDFIKNIIQSSISPTTLQIPVDISILKNDEQMIFKSNVNSHNSENQPIFTHIKGSTNVTKSLTTLGVFKIGDSVRMINQSDSITLVGLYDSQNAPNLIQRLANLEAAIQPMVNKLAVFSAGGGMVLWQKPANEIPMGWAEVVDWRGRLPIGLNVDDADFNIVGKTGGSKTATLTSLNIPAHDHYVAYKGSSNTGDYDQNNNVQEALSATVTDSPLAIAGIGGTSANDRYRLSRWKTGTQQANFFKSSKAGANIPNSFTVLNPYRIVVFIEYVG